MKLKDIKPICAFMYKGHRCSEYPENPRKKYCKVHDKLIKRLRAELNKQDAQYKAIELQRKLEKEERERKRALKEATRNVQEAIRDLKNTHLDLYIMSQLDRVDIFYKYRIIMALKYFSAEEAFEILDQGIRDR